jgi:hypothetical protein
VQLGCQFMDAAHFPLNQRLTFAWSSVLTTNFAAGSGLSRQAQTRERGASRSSTDVGYNDQFKNGDSRECNLKFLDLADCVRRTEIPLLAHNFSKRASFICRPSQGELLGTLSFCFFEDERDASKALRLIEN